MSYRITGLEPEPFQALFGLDAQALAARGIVRMIVTETPGFPDRITLRDVPVGQTVLLLNHLSLPGKTPYRASHAIFVWEGASRRYAELNEIPPVMRSRLLSLRAFDHANMLRAADVVEGASCEPLIERFLSDPCVSFIHVHNAKPGCYACRIDRA